MSEVDDYLGRGAGERRLVAGTGTAETAMVVGSTGPFSQLVGRKALAAGGTATDAVVATSLAQIALAAGGWVSYAGIFSLIHYTAATGKIDSLSGGFQPFAAETDPASIPRRPAPSGRTALVPGFMAGVAAAHQRFGALPWADLLQPSIYLAEQGFPVRSGQQRQFDLRADVLARTSEGRDIFIRDGKPPREGEVFRQPALAASLRALAAEGVAWMYEGPWAREFVEVVGREGGHVSLQDVASYQPIWSDPVSTDVYGHQVFAVGQPDRGGVALLAGLNLVEAAEIADPVTDPDALYWLIQIARQTVRTGSDLEREISKEHARERWQRMRAAGGPAGPVGSESGGHSDFVLAVDAAGNVAAACHSINTSLWGSTGLFVGGISIPDAACFQQQVLAALPPGAHLPFPTNPAIAFRHGRPVLASSSIGAGLGSSTLQCVHAVLALGAGVDEAAGRPLVHGPDYLVGDSVNAPVADSFQRTAERINGPGVGAGWMAAVRKARDAAVPRDQVWAAVMAEIPQVVDDRFGPEVLAGVEKLGLKTSARSVDDPTVPRGYWGGIAISESAPRLTGARTPFLPGEVEGL
ncbi:hypothetical protein GCM10009765_19020 [Fodinicola feengrottensis]|uniref:Gamma-glutamyltransferase n=1 Tax=Fodinicola feengrottensis TaxID=435914 RepID=A0ABN2GE29_9ACTN